MLNYAPATPASNPSPYTMTTPVQRVYSPNTAQGQPLPTVVSSVPAPHVTGTEPALAQPAPNPYVAFIEAMQTAQDKNVRAIQEMVEHRQASQAVIRSMQASDANTVAAFEKLVNQMKDDATTRAPVAPTVNGNPVPPVNVNTLPPVNVNTAPLPSVPASLPAPPLTPVPPPMVQPAVVQPAATKDMKALLQELEQLSQKVKELSSQIGPQSE